MTQQTIFDQTEKKKLEGIELVYSHANSIYPLKVRGQIVKNPTEERAVSNGYIVKELYAGKVLNINVPKGKRSFRKSRHHAPIMRWKVIK